MKTHSVKYKTALMTGAAAFLSIFILRPAFSQEPAKQSSQKKMTLKIMTDDNGKTTTIDTTLYLPDSAMMDSVRHEIDKVIELGKAGRHARIKLRELPGGFNYDFDIPSLPECPMDIGDLEDFDWEGMVPGHNREEMAWEEMAPGPGRRIMRFGGQGQTLNDLLGDIPLDHVKSYSIKDRKNGKRIVIDLDNSQMFERQQRVVVIREPGRRHQKIKYPERKVKVYVDTDDDNEKVEGTPEVPSPPSVPPPPPPPPPDNTKPKKPKI